MLDRKMHIQVLNNLAGTNDDILKHSSNIIIKIADGVCFPVPIPINAKFYLDFKIRTFEIDNEEISVSLYAVPEEYQTANINCYIIFLNDISDLKNNYIRYENKGQFQTKDIIYIPSDPLYCRIISPDHNIVLLVGHKKFTADEICTAKKYAEDNHLFYSGEWNLDDNIDDFNATIHGLIKKIRDLKLELQPRYHAAYTRGATAGAFFKKLPTEIGLHLGSFLSRNEGLTLASTCKTAKNTAEAEEENEREKPIFKK